MVASHHKQKAFGAILKNQTDVQPNPDFKKTSRQLADAQSSMPVRMAKILLQTLQRQSDFAARFFGIVPDAYAERFTQNQGFQSAKSFSRLPEKRLIFPRFRSAEICCSIRFSKRANSAGVALYSRHA
jgi:hypothetical protein